MYIYIHIHIYIYIYIYIYVYIYIHNIYTYYITSHSEHPQHLTLPGCHLKGVGRNLHQVLVHEPVTSRFLFEIMHVFYLYCDYYYIVNKLFHDNLDIDIICHDIDNPII